MTEHRTTAKKSRYLAVFEQKLLLKVVSVVKVKPKDSEGWWIQGLKRVLKRPTSTLAQKKQMKNGKVSTWAPLPTLKFFWPCYPLRENPCKEGSLIQIAKEFLTRFCIFFKSVDFVLLQEIQPFLHLLHQSSNSIFDFNLRASFARFVISSYNKTCWKSPTLNRRILAFFFWKN